ncbi:protein disulfide-isomerase tmx3a-like [Xenentodon cancila]
MDFADRVSGPLVRVLSSLQLFQHAMRRHDIMFVYVGATSELKGNFTSAAEELIVHIYFFSATRDVLPKDVSLSSLPAVMVFKDGTYLTYNEENDGDLKSWIKRERFPNFFEIDSYMLYAMGESGKLVLLALLDVRRLSAESLRYKSLVEKVAVDHKETYSRSFHFGFMRGGDYINGLVMGEVIVPSLIVVNLSNDGFFVPTGAVETERHLLDFLDGVLDGSIQFQGGNGVVQRAKRLVYEARLTLIVSDIIGPPAAFLLSSVHRVSSLSLQPLFTEAPLLGCFVIGFPLSIGAFFCYLCKKQATMEDDDDEVPLLGPSLQQKQKRKDKKTE